MRILNISINYSPIIAGAELFVQHVAENLAFENHEVVVLTRKVAGTPREEVVNGVHVMRASFPAIWDIRSSNLSRYALASIPYLVKEAIKLIKRRNIDIIHSHAAICNLIGSIAATVCKKPLMCTVQGGDLADYAETTANIPMRLLIQASLRRADLVHGVSRYAVGRARQLGARKTVLIPNGVDTDLFRPNIENNNLQSELGLERTKIVFSASRLTPKNGMDLLLRAVPNIVSEHQKVVFLIAGGGTEEAKLRRLRKKLGIVDKVILLGEVPHLMIPLYLDIADIFIRPSFEEGFGICFIEAMASGTPTIGTKVGGIPDIIRNRDNGYLIQPGSSEEIEDAISTIMQDPKAAEMMAKRARDDACRRFSWKLISDNVLKVYCSLLDQHVS